MSPNTIRLWLMENHLLPNLSRRLKLTLHRLKPDGFNYYRISCVSGIPHLRSLAPPILTANARARIVLALTATINRP